MKKDYIKPQILMERMLFCKMIAASDDDEVPFNPEDPTDADSKRFGIFVDFEDEDEDY